MQRDLNVTEDDMLDRILNNCGYENVLRALSKKAFKMQSISGQEMSARLDDLIGQFSYFPVCSIVPDKNDNVIGHTHEAYGTCPECGSVEKP